MGMSDILCIGYVGVCVFTGVYVVVYGYRYWLVYRRGFEWGGVMGMLEGLLLF